MASGSKKVIFAALIGNSLIAASKFVASAITGSSAMLTEGIHSVVDTGNQLLLLLGLRRAKEPADWQNPFGHGKEIYFWSFIVAIMIFAVGAGISVYEGIHSLMDPHPITNPLINYIVLGLAIIFEGGAWYYAFEEFRQVSNGGSYVTAVRQSKDPTTFVVLFEDSAALLGLLVALASITLGELTGILVFDGIASIIIGIILGITAAWLAYETKGLLIGESAEPGIVQGIEKLAQTFGGINKINETLTMHMGPDYILVNLSIDFEDAMHAQIVEQTIAQLSKKIQATYPRVKRIFVEAEASV